MTSYWTDTGSIFPGGVALRSKDGLSSMQLEHAILKVLADSDGPTGSGSLYLLLRGKGFQRSAPTIGRKLRELESRGFLRKLSMDGRVITPRGRQFLRQLEEDVRLESRARTLTQLLRRGDRKHIADLLEARRLIEREVAYLAARRASKTAIARLQDLIERQRRRVKQGELGIEEDVAFHEQIALASGNEIFALIIPTLRSNEQYNYLVSFIRRAVGSRLVVDHGRIFDAIRRRDPDTAKAEMDAHLTTLLQDVTKYWRRWQAETRK